MKLWIVCHEHQMRWKNYELLSFSFSLNLSVFESFAFRHYVKEEKKADDKRV